MKVLVNNKIYRMGRTEYNKMLEVASEQVTKGIYAVEQRDYAELKNTSCKSTTELMQEVRAYKRLGFKVHYNR